VKPDEAFPEKIHPSTKSPEELTVSIDKTNLNGRCVRASLGSVKALAILPASEYPAKRGGSEPRVRISRPQRPINWQCDRCPLAQSTGSLFWTIQP
jgi:hypothetical protein